MRTCIPLISHIIIGKFVVTHDYKTRMWFDVKNVRESKS